MAMRLVLMIEAHRLHPYQQDEPTQYVSPPNLGKIDHLNFSELPPTSLSYIRNEAAEGILPAQMQMLD